MGQQCTSAVDIFSFGGEPVCAWLLLSCRTSNSAGTNHWAAHAAAAAAAAAAASLPDSPAAACPAPLCAVVLWEIVTGEQPARGRLRPPRVPQECPQEVADLITRCTSADPGQRPTAQQLMEQLGLLLRRGPRGGRTSIEESVAAADTVPEEG